MGPFSLEQGLRRSAALEARTAERKRRADDDAILADILRRLLSEQHVYFSTYVHHEGAIGPMPGFGEDPLLLSPTEAATLRRILEEEA